MKERKKEKFSFEAKIKQNLKLLMLDDGFLNDFKKTEEFTQNLEKYMKKAKKDGDFMKHVLEYEDNLREEIDNNFEKHNLPSIYLEAIFLLLTEEEGLDDIVFGDNIIMGFLLKNGSLHKKKDVFHIDLYPEITLKDIQQVWPTIELLLNRDKKRNVKQRKKERINIDRDIEIYKLKKAKETNKNIMKEINIKYPKIIGYEDIPKIVKRIDKEIKGLIGK